MARSLAGLGKIALHADLCSERRVVCAFRSYELPRGSGFAVQCYGRHLGSESATVPAGDVPSAGGSVLLWRHLRWPRLRVLRR